LAAPSSNVAWTLDTMKLVASGDAEKGRQLAQACAGCHGTEGRSPSPAFPHTAGQDAAYTYKQLRDYQDGTRKNDLMRGMVAALSDQEMVDIAVFYATQTLPAPAPEGGSTEAASELVKTGDGNRLIPACSSCHGRKGEGNARSKGMPALAGQTASYFAQTMQAYRSGLRANDVYWVMRSVSKDLADEEIEALANYYAAQDAR
jgi:cytochrome c553